MNMTYVDKDGTSKNPIMGCYGIGVGADGIRRFALRPAGRQGQGQSRGQEQSSEPFHSVPPHSTVTDLARLRGLSMSQPRCQVFASKYNCSAVFSFEDFLKNAAPVVVELAGGAALKEYTLPILKSGRTLICLSSGAFTDDAFKQEAICTAAKNNGRICIVNGAIGGLDFLQTCALV